ncbi:DUF2969 domain-containing protein [Streptococcus entericus]|uniref:DUF2969 domain-containing protein n=1 Tax=Streptococcus entericus TaxID=155680 RepID=UPI0003815B33|nr:DUF2969 domain-containing protein [Streptococcus entericus]
MSKKDKKIDVQVTDAQVTVEGQQVEGFELVIGKRVIGRIAELDNKFATLKNDKVDSFFKTLDLAITHIVEEYNLNH